MKINNLKPRALLNLVVDHGSMMIKMPADDSSREYLSRLKSIKNMTSFFKLSMAVEFRIERHNFLSSTTNISRWLIVSVKEKNNEI
jgi:hypothetical protein|tara:strand:- start:208 stop:465 length:258 start_codon:yes stop_codon:yes gene_type:complete